MRGVKQWLVSLALVVAWGGVAQADDKPAKKKAESSEEKDGKDKKKAEKSDGPKVDPKGIKGISPFMEKLQKGHKLMAARDFAGAIEAYRATITEDDKNPLGHYHLGVAQLLKGDLGEAEASWQTALRHANESFEVQAKIKFALADLRERQRKLDESKGAWQDYGKLSAENPRAKGYPTTAGERQKSIDKWQELEKKYSEVKARIATRKKEQEEQRAKDAAKDAAEEEKKGGKKK